MRRVIHIVMLALIFGLFASSAGAQSTEADFVFIIDSTSSMGGEIAAVKAGLGDFVAGLDIVEIDARFAVVLFGGKPELVQDFSSDPTATETTFDRISVSGAVSGFQNNHNTNPEAGLEAIRVTLGASPEPLDRTNVGGSGGLVFRPGARINLIVVTDEDSDRPFHLANRLPGQTNNEPPGAIAGTDWQIEVDNTALAVIQNDVFLNLLVNPSDAPTRSQYGDPSQDVSDADFLNFNKEATLLALETAGYGNSLQAQVLRSGLIGRSFNILDVNTPDFIKNFFRAKIEEIVEEIGLRPSFDFNLPGTSHTVTATVQDVSVGPLPDEEVTFIVVDGPNAGKDGTGTSDVNGEVEFTYLGDGGIGVDYIEACFVPDPGNPTPQCASAVKFWDRDCQLPNGNGIADTCDIDCAGFGGLCEEATLMAGGFASCGTSNDDDGDGIPDECDYGQCVYSQGYWKNHNKYGRNPPLQIPWPIEEDTMLCDQTWLDILKTPPSLGNAFYILGHQWIAAELNVANGAETTPEVDDALAEAEALLSGCEISDDDREEAVALASLLDDYNNGLIGPPKCDFCGDDEVQEDNGEQCDDGNNDNGDGCSCDCKRQIALCGQIAEPGRLPLTFLFFLLPVAVIFIHKKKLC